MSRLSPASSSGSISLCNKSSYKYIEGREPTVRVISRILMPTKQDKKRSLQEEFSPKTSRFKKKMVYLMVGPIQDAMKSIVVATRIEKIKNA